MVECLKLSGVNISDLDIWKELLNRMNIQFHEVSSEEYTDGDICGQIYLELGVVEDLYSEGFTEEYLQYFDKNINNPSLNILFDKNGRFISFSPIGNSKIM